MQRGRRPPAREVARARGGAGERVRMVRGERRTGRGLARVQARMDSGSPSPRISSQTVSASR